MTPDLKQLLHSGKLDTLVTMLASDQVPVVQDAAEAIVSYLLATFPDAQQTTARLAWLRRLISETPLLSHDLQPNERLQFYQFCVNTLYPAIADALPLAVRLPLLADLALIIDTLPAGDDPALQRRLKAIITTRFGAAFGMTRNTRLAKQKLQQALVVMEPLVNTESPYMTDIAALSSMYRRLGNLEKHTSAAAGRHWFDKAMALQETLTTQYPDDLNYQSMLADTYVCRGSVAAETDDDQGSTWFLKHLRIYRQLARMGYQPLESARALTVAYENMGICRLENSPHAARRWLQKSYRIRARQLAEKASISALDDYYIICNLLSKANARCGRQSVAEEFLDRALEAARELYHQDPKNIRHSGILALAYQRAATMYKRKDTEQARLLYQRSQELLYELIRSGVVTPEFCCMALESLKQLERIELVLDGRSQTIWQDRIKEMNTLLEDFY
jgi:hypothetical protein